MYQDFFGLSELPFELTADPRFLYLPPRHQEALSTLKYAVMFRKGLAVLTGEAGLGKTTLLWTAFAQQDAPARVTVINNPALTRAEFLEQLARAFEFYDGREMSKTEVLARLHAALLEHRAQGTRVVLVADEAHAMPDELLEEIRLLGNIETPNGKLLSIILVGQPELAARLNDTRLRQLKQRIAVRCTLEPLTAREISAYVTHRLRVAGMTHESVFSPEALAAVHQKTGGIPRVINVVCDNALVTAFAANERRVGAAIIREVSRDFDLDAAPAPTRGPSRAADALPEMKNFEATLEALLSVLARSEPVVSSPVPAVNAAVAEVSTPAAATATVSRAASDSAPPVDRHGRLVEPQSVEPPPVDPPLPDPVRETDAAPPLFRAYARPRASFFGRVFSR